MSEQEKKHDKNKLQHNSDRTFLNMVLDVSRIGFWELDLKTDDYQYSPELATMLGYGPDEIPETLEAWLSLVHEADRQKFFPIINRDIENNKPYTYDFRMKCKDGSYRWIEASGKLYKKDENGESRYLFGIHRDITKRIKHKEALLRKLNTVLQPDVEIGESELSDFLDVDSIQSLMDKYYDVTHIGMAIVDLKGKVLVKTGWQDICLQFHRVCPQTLKNCIESDKYLSKNDTPGHFKLYKCKNNMWDISTPIYIGGKHMGYLFFGQFFFDDEKVDVELFRKQACQYGFDEEKYLSALKRVPRFSRKKVNKAMVYYIELLNLITNLSFNRIKLARMGAELKTREEQFRAVFETAEDNIFIKDVELKYVRVNPSMEKALGIKAEEIINKPASALFDEKLCQEITENDKSVLDGETVEAFYKIPVHGNMHIFYTIKVPLRDEDGNINGLCGITRDITEMKRAEEALRENRNLLDSIINSLPGDLLVVDSQFNIILANKSRLKGGITAYESIEQVRGKKCYRVFQDKDHPCPWCKVADVLLSGRADDQTTSMDDPREISSGKALKILVTPLKDEGGKIFGAVEYGLEVSELRNAKNKAEAANKTKTEFLATMSHELRTPLNGVIGFSEILKGTALDENQREFLDIVILSANNLLGLISDILDLSKIESNKLDLITEKTDIRKLVKNTLEVVQSRGAEKGIALERDVENTFPGMVLIDPLRFKQVLLNLLTNAIKFTDEGSVTVTVSKRWMNEEKKQLKLHFSVRDTGIGIKQEHQKMIFEAFSQVDMSITRKYGGTGLGLSISRRLLEKMGSTLQLTSIPGKGSDFFFELVLSYYDQEKQEDPSKVKSLSSKKDIQTPDLAGKKILIAEDDPINMRLTKTALKRFSKDLIILEAKDGKEAIDQFKKESPNLIFMDIVMPEADGYQATKMIRQLDGQIPIIAMTAKALKEDKAACLNSGMNEYITKPISLSVLKETLVRYLRTD